MSFTIAEIQQGLRLLHIPGGSEQAELQGGAETLDVAFLGSGFEADVFAFSVEAGERRDFILRLYTGQNVVEKAAREFAAMRRLRRAGYPVPEVSTFESARSGQDRALLAGFQKLVKDVIG